MLELYIPAPEELAFREQLMNDEETMSYNHAWGGTIPFPEEQWKDWYDFWIARPEGKRFYRYLKESGTDQPAGEIAWHYDEERKIHIANVIIYAPLRHKGYGREGLKLLCSAAKQAGIAELYDDIAIDNPAISLFLSEGFAEEYRTDEIIMLKKDL